MSFYQDDLRKLGSLMYEDFDMGIDTEAGLDDGSTFSPEPDVGVDVMEIEPMAPLESVSEEDNKVLKADLKKLAEYASRLKDMDTSQFEPWMFAKITKAADYVDDVWHMLDVEVDYANTGFEQAGPEQDLNF